MAVCLKTWNKSFPTSGLQWIFLVVFVIGLVSPVHFAFAFLMAGFSILFIAMFASTCMLCSQPSPSYHTCLTVPWNVQMPFMKYLWKYMAMFAASPDTAVGVGVKTKGTIKIHVLSTRARRQIKYTWMVSVLGFGASIFMFLYCYAFGGYRAWQLEINSDWNIFLLMVFMV